MRKRSGTDRHAPPTQPSPRPFWLLLGILAAYMLVLSVVPDLVGRAMGYTGSLRLFALSNVPHYTPVQAYAWLAEYGSQGRRAYAVTLAIFDSVFPLLYASFLAVGLRLVGARLGLPPWLRRLAGRVPFAATAANWLADAGILTMLLSYPHQPALVATLASVLTLIKFLVLAISAIALLGGGSYLLARLAVAGLRAVAQPHSAHQA